MINNSEVDKIYDAVIIGSGPSGAATAKALSDSGLKALILEKKKLPRFKCCSGVLFGESQVLLKEYFGTLPPEEVYCRPKVINAGNVRGYAEEKGYFPWYWEWPKEGKDFPKDYFNVWRNKFDYWLVQESKSGVVDKCAFESFSIENNRVKVRARKEEKLLEHQGRYLVGADGGSSKVRAVLDPDFKKKYKELMVYQAYYRLEPMVFKQDHWHVFLDSSFGFSCLHVKDELLTVCVGPPSTIKVKTAMENLKSFLKKKFQLTMGELVRHEGCRINTMFVSGTFHQGRGRVLLVGDAAGLIHMNGSGIDTGLDSGYRAGKAIAEALATDGDAWELYYKQTKDIRDHVKECSKHNQLFRRK